MAWNFAFAAQTVQLSERNSGSRTVSARIGETIDIAVDAQFGRFSASSGFSLYIGLPHGAFEVVHSGLQSTVDVTPFKPGQLLRECSGHRQSGDAVNSRSSKQPRDNPIRGRIGPRRKSSPHRIRHSRDLQTSLHRCNQRGKNKCLQQPGIRVPVGIRYGQFRTAISNWREPDHRGRSRDGCRAKQFLGPDQESPNQRRWTPLAISHS